MSKIIFLDRDGVINKYPGDKKYVTSWEEFKFIRGSLTAIKKLTEADYKIFIVSNQAGVSKGLYSKKHLDVITKNMLKRIEQSGGKIQDIQYCLHKEEEDCSCRKPKPGLVNKILNKLKKINNKSAIYIVGDDIRDIKTGINAKLRTILVLSGRERFENRKKWQVRPNYIFRNLLDAANFVIDNNGVK
ncbi:MAG: HAD-IIIA family hydrolase [Patescibacteria group bacterium]